MSKHFYLFAIAIVLLQIVTGLSQSILFWYDGTEIFQREEYAPWLLFSSALSLVLIVVLSHYFLAKRYWIAFCCLILFALSSGWYLVGFYKITRNESADFLQYASIAAMSAAIVYYTSLIVSQAGRNSWLRLTGIVGFALYSGLIYTYVTVTGGPSFHTLGNMMRFQQVIFICLNLLPILLVLNFSR
ncbi:MAG TPA: hypothetical protein VM101_05005 [Flavitalea sp.]|nr:hypothetical protein [Flavitalea sp.]